MKRTGIAIALIGGTLVICTKLFSTYNLPKFILISLGATLASFGVKPQSGPPLFRGLWVFLWVVLASCFFSLDPLVSFVGTTDNYFYGLLPLCCAAAVFLAASQEGFDPRNLLILVGGVCSAYAVFQGLVGEPFNGIPGDVFDGRVYSFPGSPVLLASVLVLAFPFALERRNWVSVALIAVATLMTQSRGGIVGILAASGCYAWVTGRRKQVILCVLVALAAVFVVRRNTATGSDSNRLNAWRCAVSYIPKAPFLGSGPDTFVEVYKRERTPAMVVNLPPTSGHYEAHNDILQVVATTGLLGLAAYLFFLFSLGREILKTGRNLWGFFGPTYAVGASAVFGIFVFAKFSPMPLYTTCLTGALVAWLLPRNDYRVSGAQVLILRGACLLSLALSLHLAHAEYLLRKARPGPEGAQVETVLSWIKRGADAAPWVQEYQAAYAQYLAMLGRHGDHRRVAERNFVFHPDVAMSYHMMAVTEKMDGNLGAAREYLAGAKSRDPLSRQVEILEKELNP